MEIHRDQDHSRWENTAKLKGATGEREAAHILSDLLGKIVKRKLGAARDGGSDIDIQGYSIEVKH